MILKKCTKCKRELPATLKYFYESRTNKVGLRPTCIKCSKLQSIINKKKIQNNIKILYESINRKNLYKKCSRCKKLLLATRDFFFLDPTGKYCLRAKCKKCFSEETKKLKQTKKYKLKSKEYRKRHYRENKKEYAERWQIYYKANREYLLKKQKEYCQNNRKKIRIRDRKYREIPQNRLSDNFSRLIRQSLTEGKNGNHWEDLVGYNLKELINHLEKQFKDGMTWNNYGDWHIDHIIPVSLWEFKSYSDEEFKQCWALCNLQPLWAEENISKGSKVLVNYYN